jgi:hypothetical protein
MDELEKLEAEHFVNQLAIRALLRTNEPARRYLMSRVERFDLILMWRRATPEQRQLVQEALRTLAAEPEDQTGEA